MAIYFPNTPATYIHIPKCAGTVFNVWSRHFVQNCTEGETSRHWRLDQVKEVWPDPGTVFTFVRNPYARMVSMFFWFGQAAKKRLDTKFKHATDKDILIDIREVKLLDAGFDNYIKKIYEGDFDSVFFEKDFWRRSDPQVNWFAGETMDIVIKVEELESKFSVIQDLLDCHVPFLPALNASEHDHYSTYYTKETQRMVYEMFKADFEAFEYSYDF